MKCSASLKIEIKLILSDIKSNICSLFKKKQKIQETIKDGKITNYLTTWWLWTYSCIFIHRFIYIIDAFFYFSKIELVLHGLFFNTMVEILSVSVHVALGYNFSDSNVLPWGFPGGSEGKVSACNAGNLGLIPGSGRSPGEGNGNPHQSSFLENPMDGGAW